MPSEDSAALLRSLRPYRGGRFLEIGVGSGAVLQSVAPRFALAVGTDILSVAEARAARDGSEVVITDRASCFRGEVFDLVAFNPPYLPSNGIEDRTVDGGVGGIQVPLAFLEEALRVMKRDGRTVLLLSDESDVEGFRRTCEGKGLRIEEKGRTDLFYERLYVFEVRRAA